MVGMKTCPRCGETKPLDEFHRNRREADGRQSRCKTCRSARPSTYVPRQTVVAERMERNRELLRDGQRWCSRCEQPKPLDEFHRGAGYCTTCKRAASRESYERHPERARARSNAWHAELRTQVFAHYGEACACCGEAHREFLGIDHIDGGGTAHRRELARTGSTFYAWLRQQRWPSGYRILCHNCNQALGSYGYCPHEAEIAHE